MELIGTVVLPLIGLVSGALGAGFAMIGWGKPVPINPYNLKHPRIQDCLIAMAGPAMNFILAFALLGVVKLGLVTHQLWLLPPAALMAQISLFLCFFNLLPIPPLDGSHLLMNLTGMSYEFYSRLALPGFVLIIILIQFRPVLNFLVNIVAHVFRWMQVLVGL
jgi:Zn-dependent protease